MALLAILLVGALLGWLATVIERVEAPSAIRLQMFLGVVASLIGAVAFGGSSGIFSALQLITLGTAVASAIVVLALYWAVFVRRT